MVTESWTVNSSPLILLGKIGRVNLLTDVAGRVSVPVSVVEEIQVGDGGESIVNVIQSDERFHIKDNVEVPPNLLGWDLGSGETQVIALALESGSTRVVLDDREARRSAKSYDVPVIGTLGLVGRAKEQRIIRQAKPVIKELCDNGLYASDELVSWILDEVGESR